MKSVTVVRSLGVLGVVACAGLALPVLAAPVHTTIATLGTPTPAGGTYGAFNSAPVVNASGQVSFLMDLTGGPGGSGIFVGNGGAVSTIAVNGGTSPVGGTFTGFSAPAINDSGAVFFSGSVTGGSAGQALIRNSGGTNTALLVRGGAAPTGGTWQGFSSIAANNSGQVAFSATLTGGSASNGLFRTLGGTTTTLGAAGSPAPAAGNYTSFSSINDINASGAVAFLGSTSGGGGIFRTDGVTSVAVAAAGLTTPIGGTYNSFSAASTNDAGYVVFNGGSTSSTSTFAAIYDGVTTSILANVGGSVIGLPGLTIASVSTPQINNSGIAVVRVTMTGVGVTTANDTAFVFGTNPSNLTLLVREGDTINIGGSPDVLTGNLSTAWSIGENGFAWRAVGASRSAIMYTSDSRLFVPTPGAGAVLGLGALALGRRRR